MKLYNGHDEGQTPRYFQSNGGEADVAFSCISFETPPAANADENDVHFFMFCHPDPPAATSIARTGRV